jgi:prevent-host-death family protein
MQVIRASEFKAKCLALMDQVAATGEGILITRNGKPVAELHPPAGLRPKSPIGLHKGLIETKGARKRYRVLEGRIIGARSSTWRPNPC